MLDPVANAPHPGSDRVRARAMLAAIAAATGVGADVEEAPSEETPQPEVAAD